jgi:hypothetical protein
VRAFTNGDHGAATHSLPEQRSHGGSERMTVTVCPQPVHRNDPVAVMPCSTRVSAAADSMTPIVDPFRIA